MADLDYARELIEKYVDGLATDSEVSELDRLLAVEEGVARAFVRITKCQSYLDDFFRGESERAALPHDAAHPHRAHRHMPVSIPSQPPQRPSVNWNRGITAAAAALLVALGFLIHEHLRHLRPVADGPRQAAGAPVAIGVVTAVRGEAYVQAAGAGRRAVRRGEPLFAGDTLIATESGDGVTALLDNSTLLELHPAAAVVVGAGPAGPAAGPGGWNHYAFVERGLVRAAIDPGGGRQVTLASRHAEVMVLGTEFTLSVTEEKTRVQMRRGEVRVRNTHTDEAVIVREGFYAVLSPTSTDLRKKEWREESTPVQVSRVREDLQALYLFVQAGGFTVQDVSGVGTPLHLRITDWSAVRWVVGGGLTVIRPTTVSTLVPAEKIINACRASQELTVELWIRPSAFPTEHLPQRMLSLERKVGPDNVALGMYWDEEDFVWSYVALRKTAGAEMLRVRGYCVDELTHLVYTQDRAGLARFYVNGGCKTTNESKQTWKVGDFSKWEDGTPLILANGADGRKPWLGEFQLVALYSRALRSSDVRRNFKAGIPRPETVVRSMNRTR
ncbi:MAG: FecR domain-containing protein [Kiritimatiellae bacterium]|nr:FecR domain-containing protein [Kiritimatiellia bacterium]